MLCESLNGGIMMIKSPSKSCRIHDFACEFAARPDPGSVEDEDPGYNSEESPDATQE